jgi:pimeloyl-ACP methyl ester carboxylesterase
MDTLYTKDRKQFLTYHKYNPIKKKAPFVIFHHGLMSNMDGSKAMWLENHCKKNDYNFIRFDNFGHGSASGKFSEATVSDWLMGLNLIIDQLTTEPVILVGSSMGAWITMLTAISRPKNIIGMIGISSAPDFSEELIWNNLTDKQKNLMQTEGVCDVGGRDPECNHIYPISFDLIKDGRIHLLLNKDKINITCPVHLLHGMQDTDVPHTISERIFSKINHNDVTLKLIKDANHSLSRPKDLEIICNSLDEMIFSL